MSDSLSSSSGRCREILTPTGRLPQAAGLCQQSGARKRRAAGRCSRRLALVHAATASVAFLAVTLAFTMATQVATAPRLLDGLADLQRKRGLCLGERLGAVLVAELGAILGCALLSEFPYDLGVLGGQSDGFFLGIAEHYFAEGATCRVVHVDDCPLAACDGIYGALDEVFSCGGEDLSSTFFQCPLRRIREVEVESERINQRGRSAKNYSSLVHCGGCSIVGYGSARSVSRSRP